MADPKTTGRMLGAMLLLQFVAIMVGFILITAPLQTDYLATAGPNAVRIKAGLLVLLANCALTIGISIAAWRIVRRHSQTAAIWLIAVSVFMFVMQGIDAIHSISMVNLSQQHLATGDVVDSIANALRAKRRWTHFVELWAIDAWLITFYAIVLGYGLIPRVVAGLSLLTVVIHLLAIPLPGILGYGINTTFGVPLAFGMLLTAGWLIVRGIGGEE
jgi:hypothetical protein